MLALSPDGAHLAYVANNRIYLRSMNEAEARPVPGTEEPGVGPTMPAFSPDGQWLVYLSIASGTGPFVIKRVPLSGGAPIPIHEGSGVLADIQQGLSWPTPDTILFAAPDGIVRIPANGGAQEVLVPRAEGERFFSPQLLPGGEAILFTRLLGPPGSDGLGLDRAQVVVQSIGGDDRTVVWQGGSAARYLPSGYLTYAQRNALFAIPFDADTRSVRGSPVQMVRNLFRGALPVVTDTANVAVSDTGTLALVQGVSNIGVSLVRARAETTLVWVDRDGNEEPLDVRPDDYTQARISPDGQKIALAVGSVFQAQERPPAIWMYDLTTGNLSLVSGDISADAPVWSTDGRRLFFRSMRQDAPGIYVVELDTREITLVAAYTADAPFAVAWSISPDDGTLALVSSTSGADINLATLSLADGKFTPLLQAKEIEVEPSIAPNGAWIAYQLGASAITRAGSEIEIRPFPAISSTRIPVGQGERPVFSSDGSELFFFDGHDLATAPISCEPTLRVGKRRKLFELTNYVVSVLGRSWDVDPSGERFLMIRSPDAPVAATETSRPRMDIVLNWFEELKERVPAE